MGPYPPPHGGVQTNLVAIRRFLLSRGIPCAVINLTRYRREDGDEIYYPPGDIPFQRLERAPILPRSGDSSFGGSTGWSA